VFDFYSTNTHTLRSSLRSENTLILCSIFAQRANSLSE
jgi:hypothetical protein